MLVTDKTGTLTTGEKVVAELVLAMNGTWKMHTIPSLKEHTSDDHLPRETLLMMFALALCNSCDVEEEANPGTSDGVPKYRYSYTSSDDKALVECSAIMGFSLSASSPNSMQVLIALGCLCCMSSFHLILNNRSLIGTMRS